MISVWVEVNERKFHVEFDGAWNAVRIRERITKDGRFSDRGYWTPKKHPAGPGSLTAHIIDAARKKHHAKPA